MQDKKILATSIIAAGLLVATVASAQMGPSTGRAGPADASFGPRLERTSIGGRAGFRARGALGLRSNAPFGDLALGTEVQARLYDAEPTEGVAPVQTLDFTYGEDSEVAFAEELDAARESATYMVIATGEQSRTIDLPGEGEEDTDARASRLVTRTGFGPSLDRLEQGDTVTVVFYDGDPQDGGQELETVEFTHGESSAAGFRNDIAEAAEEADFVVVTTPPQERVIDLTASPDRMGAPGSGFGFGRR